jgi:hypothetical protein
MEESKTAKHLPLCDGRIASEGYPNAGSEIFIVCQGAASEA